MPRNKQAARIEAIVNAMQEHGPLSVPRLVELTGWSPQTLRDQLARSVDVFEKLSDAAYGQGSIVAGTWYLRDASLSEDEFDRMADEQCRNFNWWPALDHSLDHVIGQMVRGAVHEMRGA